MRTMVLMAAVLTGTAMAQGWPETPPLNKVGRGTPVPTTVLEEIVARPGETAQATTQRAAERARAYTAQTGFEACALVCENAQGQRGLRLTTNHSQVACRTERTEASCPVGFAPTSSTLHTHPHTDVVWANPVDAVLIGVRRGQRLGLKPHDFSPRDRANGPGYLATETALLFQEGVALETSDLAVEHDH